MHLGLRGLPLGLLQGLQGLNLKLLHIMQGVDVSNPDHHSGKRDADVGQKNQNDSELDEILSFNCHLDHEEVLLFASVGDIDHFTRPARSLIFD